MSKRKQPIEKLETIYTVERWYEYGGYWDRQVSFTSRNDASKCMLQGKKERPDWNFRVRKTVETVVAAA